jgi:hypothetical protein
VSQAPETLSVAVSKRAYIKVAITMEEALEKIPRALSDVFFSDIGVPG